MWGFNVLAVEKKDSITLNKKGEFHSPEFLAILSSQLCLKPTADSDDSQHPGTQHEHQGRLGHGLGLAVNKIIHYHDINGSGFVWPRGGVSRREPDCAYDR